MLAAALSNSDGGVSADEYSAAREALDAKRIELAHLKRTAGRAAARLEFLRFVDEVAFPTWAGTPWAFHGVSQTPRKGQIACGYFVTTVLSHGGFRIDRISLAQQASAYIVDTMARGSHVEWYRSISRREVVNRVRERFGEGLFIVGLDFHVGFIRLDGGREEFCHASYLEPGTVLCEPAATAAAFASTLYVVGDALTDRALDDWLLHREIKTRAPQRRSRGPTAR